MMMCCASCGRAEIDDIKLKKCKDCDLVKYCSDKCLENHRPCHDEECKKRRAELRDRDLFTVPESSHLGECPICCLPLPIDECESRLMSCCSKNICNGCDYTNAKRESEAGLEQRCAYCREPQPKSIEEAHKRLMARVKKNCPVAMRHMGKICRNQADYETALEYLTKAAELGDTGAHFSLSVLYLMGQGVEKDIKKYIYHSEEAAIGGHPTARHNLGCLEWNLTKAAELGDAKAHFLLSCLYHKGQGVEKDEKKEVFHSEEAAIGGHPTARHNLGCEEYENGFKRVRKHFIIAANLGDHDSLKLLKELYADGHASKEDYAAALRGYQAAVEATKSAERKKAGEAIKNAN